MLFSGRNKKNIITLSSADFARRVVKVKPATVELFNPSQYSWLSFSQTHLSQITAYLEVKIWSLPKHENLTTVKNIVEKRRMLLRSNFSFPQYFQYISNFKSPITHIHVFVKCGCSNYFFLKSENLIDWLCWGLTTRQPLRVILCRLPEKGRKEIRSESRGDEREGQGRKRNRNESEETEEIKTFPLYPYPLQG